MLRAIWVIAVFAILAMASQSTIAGPPDDAEEEATLEKILDKLEQQSERIRELESRLEETPGPELLEREISAQNDSQSDGYVSSISSESFRESGTARISARQVDSRLTKLEKIFNNWDGDTSRFLVPGHSGATMKIVGRVHADYWAFPDESPGINAFETGSPGTTPQDEFGFRRMRFGVRGDVSDNMEYRIEAEFAGGNNFEFRDAWLGFKHLPFLQKVLIGNQKRPYGLDHLNSSRFNVFMERPYIVEAFNQDARRMGIVSYGVSDDQEYNWRFGVFNQRLIQDEGRYVSDHYQPEFAARLANTIWYDECSDGRGYAHWGIAGTVAFPDGSAGGDPTPLGSARSQNEARFRTRPEGRSISRWMDTGRIAGTSTYEIVAAEAVLNLGAFQLVGEYENMFLQRDDISGLQDLHFHGGYVYASYFLTGEHMPWNRKSGTLGRVKPFENFFIVRNCDQECEKGWGAWQVAVRYSTGDLSDRDVLGGEGESVTIGLNWLWNPYARMQFNYIFGEINNHVAVAGQTSGDYQILGTRFMIDF